MKLTPVEKIDGIYFKRDDLFSVAGVSGGKARTCWYLAKGAKGIITAGSRQSPQIKIAAYIAKELGIPCRAHCPQGELSIPLKQAKAAGCEIIQHKAGYNSVIIKRATDDVKANNGFTYIPFGMQCTEAVNQTRQQVQNIPRNIDQIVITIGSGMSAAGLLYGLQDIKLNVPVFGICVGASPIKRLNMFAPPFWHQTLELFNAGIDYHKESELTEYHGIELDPIYEAKCIPWIHKNTLMWIIGHRNLEE